MRRINRVVLIAKTQFTNYLRYPENFFGYLVYIGAILFVGLLFQFFGGSNAERIFGTYPILYYTTSLFLFTLIGNQNSAAMAFSIWRLDILSKPLNPELFLLGNYFGSLLSSIIPSIFLLFLSLAISLPSLTVNSAILMLTVLVLSFVASIGVSYFFAVIGLRTTPHGYLYTSLTFLLTILVGIFIPISVIPVPLRWLSYIIPYTWAIDCFRGIFLGIPTLLPLETEILVLLISGTIALFLGRLCLFHTLKCIKSKKVIVR